MKKIVRTSIRMDGDLHGQLSDFVHELKKRDKKSSIDWVIQNAVRSWLAENDPEHATILPPDIHSDDQRLGPWIELLRSILESNNQVAIDAITRNLQAFNQLIRVAPGRGKAVVMTPEEIEEAAREMLSRVRRDRKAG